MKFSIAAIALLFAANSLVAATTVKGRTLKGQPKVRKSKKSNDPCPKRAAYNAPPGCIDKCYSDMTKLSTDINAALAVPGPTGPTFTGTVCSGTWVWPATASVSGAVANAKLDLSCCGSESSCIITGEKPSVIRTTSLMEFKNPFHLILQGLSFSNIVCNSDGALVAGRAASVVEVKNVMVDSVVVVEVSYYPVNSGGVFFLETTDATISDSKFTNNQIDNIGGVISAYRSFIHTNGNAFKGNKAKSLGGAVSLVDSTLFATCNTFENNTAINGGAIYGDWPHIQLANNKFLGNQARVGGAVHVSFQTIVSSGNTYSKNIAFDTGGAVAIYNGAVELVDDIFTENSAPLNSGSNVHLGFSVLKYCNCPTLTSKTIFAEDSTSQLLAQCV